MNAATTTQTRRRARRGAALPTALALLLFMGIFGAGLLGLVSGSLQMAQRGDDAAEALNMADGGLDLAMCWFSQQGTPPDGAAVLFPAGNQFFGTNGTIPHPFSATADGSRLTVRITWDVTNSGSVQKHYVVDSTATTASGATATVRAFVQQSSFGKYAVFLDSTPPNAYWGSGLNVFDGPVHSNNSDGGSPPTANGAANNIVWGDGSGGIVPKPIFTYGGNDAFTVSGPAVNWYRNSYGNASAPASEAEWRMIATGGSGSVQTGVPMIAMPSATATQQFAAMGQTPPAGGGGTPSGLPNTLGVTVPHSGGNGGPATGGLYIHGDVQQMTLSVAPGNSTTQIIQVKQTDANANPYTTTITLNASNNSTSVHVDYMAPNGNSGTYSAATTDASYTGVTNGVVYCDGSVGGQTAPKTGGVAGVVADGRALTLATDTSHNVNINGSLTYKTPRQKDASGNLLPESDPANAAFRSSAGTLGIVSDNVQVVDKDTSGNWIQNIEVDAAVMAFGTYDAADYANRPVGSMLNMGTYIVKTRGLFSVGSGLNVVSGIPCSRLYDNRLADHPPPYFPTTGSHYDVVSWQRVVAPLP